MIFQKIETREKKELFKKESEKEEERQSDGSLIREPPHFTLST
jgi:hypothetical protein